MGPPHTPPTHTPSLTPAAAPPRAARYQVAYPDTLDYGVNATLLDACDLPHMDVDSPAWSARSRRTPLPRPRPCGRH